MENIFMYSYDSYKKGMLMSGAKLLRHKYFNKRKA